MDDFDTGYSSLSYLRDLPIDELKLGRSFVFPMVDDARAAALVEATIPLAHSLNLRMVAEGVENHVAYTELARLGCDQAQGYHMSRPVPTAVLDHWLSTREASNQATDIGQPLPSGPPLRKRRIAGSPLTPWLGHRGGIQIRPQPRHALLDCHGRLPRSLAARYRPIIDLGGPRRDVAQARQVAALAVGAPPSSYRLDPHPVHGFTHLAAHLVEGPGPGGRTCIFELGQGAA